MKIVYCLNSIRYLGGIQRVTVVKANALAEIEGNEVYIIVTDNKKGVHTETLSPKVHLIDLDINYYSDDWKSKWNVLKGIFFKRKEHKKRLRDSLNKIQPDIVISVGQSEKNMVPTIKGKWKTIRELHFVKDYRMRQANNLFSKILAYCGDIYDFHYKIKKYDKIVVLTQEDKESNWKGFKNVIAIPNPSTFHCEKPSTQEHKRIISVGRLSMQKNYASLIRAYRNVADKHPDWTLEIFGEGEQKIALQTLILQLKLEKHVFLKGYTNNVQNAMSQSSIFVLSSIFEGFGLVIVEAMACGLPVVSYDCPCGPKDIITEGEDGYLVPINNEKVLAEKISLLIEDEELRKDMGKAAIMKAEQYNVNNITTLWMNLFYTLRHGK